MASEEAPLLTEESSQAVLDHEAVYKRFTPAHKRLIVAITALVGTFPMYTSGMFIPLIPQIARDLDSTPSVVSLAVSLSVLANAVGSLTWASYSGFYGRRPVLLLSMLILAIASVGSGSASTVPSLLIWRIIQAFGAASGLSVGIAVLADIYKMEERGTASGAFFGAILFGMALAPTIAGVSAYYWSWRATQYQLFWAAALAFTFTYQFQPETSQPGSRGLDKLIEKEGRSRWVWLNPFKNIVLLRSPNVLFISLAQGCVVITDYVLLVPIAYTFGKKYGITNEAIIGALCIPVGMGNILGSNLAGRYSDKLIVSLRKRRGGVWVPEDRLRATLLGGIILAPCSVLVSGIATQFTDGKLSIIVNTICFVLNGIGVSVVFNPANAYLVDILHHRSAEITSANMAVRCVIVAFLVGFIIPSLEAFGVAITFAGAAVISWLGYSFICIVIIYGDRLRAWIDLGWSTQQNN